MSGDNCDLCGKAGNWPVLASSLGPASFRKCDKCEKEGAEPFGIASIYLYARGGIASLSEEDRRISVRVDGECRANSRD